VVETRNVVPSNKTESRCVVCSASNFIVECKFVQLVARMRTVVMTSGCASNCISETTVSVGVDVICSLHGV
jgi:hypothetical protein